MKIKFIYSLLFSSIIALSVSAQKEKIKFHSINQYGIAFGESEVNSVLQTINGIKFSNSFCGIGIGVDNYRYKTLPVFIAGRRYFDEGNKAFAYADLGYSFPLKNLPGKEVYYYNSFHFTGGIYMDAGIGYQLSLSKNSSFIFSMGYSYKKIHNNIGIDICPFNGPCYVDYNKYDLDFGRMVLKTGLAF